MLKVLSAVPCPFVHTCVHTPTSVRQLSMAGVRTLRGLVPICARVGRGRALHPARAVFSSQAGLVIDVATNDGKTNADEDNTASTSTEPLSCAISVFEMFAIGIGPSSSHTVGPMRAAERFASILSNSDYFGAVTKVKCNLYGSLALTGIGHGTPGAVMHGLEGHLPDSVDIETYDARVAEIKSTKKLVLAGRKAVEFDDDCLPLLKDQVLPAHSNGMEFFAYDSDGEVLCSQRYYSIGGGFFVTDEGFGHDDALFAAGDLASTTSRSHTDSAPFPFRNAKEVFDMCESANMTVPELAMQNELVWRSQADVETGLLGIWDVMDSSIQRGLHTTGVLKGGLNRQRRAPGLRQNLEDKKNSAAPELSIAWHSGMLYDAVAMWAIAVNEENADGGRVVTAPTNGAAGVIPAVLKYYLEFVLPTRCRRCDFDPAIDIGCRSPHVDRKYCLAAQQRQGVIDFLLAAGVVGMLFKGGASISAAEVGCQGEVGVASSMAAAALAAVEGGTLAQVESAAEIAMEHFLGMTCDPVDGLVQVPCIERNVMGAVKAITASRLALANNFKPDDGGYVPIVTLDNVISSMYQTGKDMQSKYKETSLGGLAITVQVPVSIPAC